MTPEARNWLMRWSLGGRAQIIAPEQFVVMPEEVFDYLPAVSDTDDGLVRSGDSGFYVPKTEGWTQWAIGTGPSKDPNQFGFVPKVVITRCRNAQGTHFFVQIAGLAFKKPAPEWFEAKSFPRYHDAMVNAKEKIQCLKEREERKNRGH
jgi:hypothetical protein